MNTHEAEAFLIWNGWDRTPVSEQECRCTPPSWSDPTGDICAACEARADDAYAAEAEREFWRELEFDRDYAFEVLVADLRRRSGILGPLRVWLDEITTPPPTPPDGYTPR